MGEGGPGSLSGGERAPSLELVGAVPGRPAGPEVGQWAEGQGGGHHGQSGEVQVEGGWQVDAWEEEAGQGEEGFPASLRRRVGLVEVGVVEGVRVVGEEGVQRGLRTLVFSLETGDDCLSVQN